MKRSLIKSFTQWKLYAEFHPAIKKTSDIRMKHFNELPQVQSVIVNSGFVATKSPSIDCPIPVTLAYCINADGSLRWLFPEAGSSSGFSRFYISAANISKIKTRMYGLLFALRLGKLIAHGRTIMYTNLPTATYINTQWKRS